ncbi:MAG: S8 family serine peptidase [Tepidisphaeraceae bacterium]
MSCPSTSLSIESLEPRRLFAWADYAQLINQDLAATNFPNATGKGVTVAVIDTGINYGLPQLGGGIGPGFKVLGGHDFVDGDDQPIDSGGHGTAVAAAVAGSPWTVGGVTYQGIAPEANLVALRITKGGPFGDAVIEAALQWVIEHREEFNITVVNMSIGDSNKFNETHRDPKSDELKELARLGVFVAVASGNSNDGLEPPIHQDGISSPAADPNSFAVGAVDDGDVIADFAQRGTELDLLAPGVQVVLPGLHGGFEAMDGTSFASPMVAGAAALIKQLDLSALPRDIGSILMSSGARNLDGDNEDFGTSGLQFTRLDVDAALKLARQRIGKYQALDFGSTFDTAVDSQGILHAAWYDADNGRVLYSARDASGLWSNVYVVDDAGDVGANLSIAVDSLGHVGIGYFDSTNTALKYATMDADPGQGWVTQVIESSKHVGTSPSLGYDLQGNGYLAYYRRSGGDVKVATLDRDAGTWTLRIIDGTGGTDVGKEVSLDVGEAPFHVEDGFTIFNTTIAIAYADTTNGNLKYARFNLDDPGDDWVISTVDDTNGVDHINLNLHFGSPQTGLQAQIAYQDVSTADVRYAYRKQDWFVETVASTGRLGYHVQMYFNVNTPIIVYSNEGQKSLYTALRTGDNAWTSRRTTPSFGPQSVAQNKRTNSVFLSWLNADQTAVNALQVI